MVETDYKQPLIRIQSIWPMNPVEVQGTNKKPATSREYGYRRNQ
ncbi:hypothetical protein [Psychrobacter sp. NG25]|nr:hypothetical protein [Psychrobacter sp. NG25]